MARERMSRSEPSSNKTMRTDKRVAARKPISYKRFIMLQRRLKAVISERSSWEEKNKELSDELKAEKLRSATFRRESFHYQRLHHETVVALNSFKVNQSEIAESLAVCVREINSTYPHIVAFSESLTTNKIRLSNLLNILPPSDHIWLQKLKNGGGEHEEYKEIGKPTKHKVGPMVKGLQIVTKPKIMIERLMLPQAQDQDQVTADDDIEVNNPLTPIPEESEHVEDPCIRHVSVRPKRTKLGSKWRIKREEKIKKEQERKNARENQTPDDVPYSGDSTDSDTIQAVIDPAVRRLMKPPSSHKVNSGHGGENVIRQSDGRNYPMRPFGEGCSWMNNNPHWSSHDERRSSIYKVDSSDDDEDDILVPRKAPDTSCMNTLLLENQSFNHSATNKTKKSRSPGHNMIRSPNRNSARDEPVEEPDSTNGDSQATLIRTRLSFKESTDDLFKHSSSSPSVSSSRNSPELSTDYGTANNTLEQRLSNRTSMPSVRLSKVSDRLTLGDNSVGSSSVCNTPESSFVEDIGKRVRKPANHRYPSEDYVVLPSKQNKGRLSIGKKTTSGRKSGSGKDKLKGVKSLKERKSSSTGLNSMDTNTDGPELETLKSNIRNGSIAKRSTKQKARKSSSTGLNSVDTNTDGAELETLKSNIRNGSVAKRSIKRKASAAKKSNDTPKNPKTSLLAQSQGSEESKNCRPRRNNSGINYKESPINVKKRRP